MRRLQTAKIDHLDDQLRAADAAAGHLFRRVMESAGERLSTIRRIGKTGQIDRLLEGSAMHRRRARAPQH